MHVLVVTYCAEPRHRQPRFAQQPFNHVARRENGDFMFGGATAEQHAYSESSLVRVHGAQASARMCRGADSTMAKYGIADLARPEVGAPTAQVRNIHGLLDRVRLANEPAHLR